MSRWASIQCLIVFISFINSVKKIYLQFVKRSSKDCRKTQRFDSTNGFCTTIFDEKSSFSSSVATGSFGSERRGKLSHRNGWNTLIFIMVVFSFLSKSWMAYQRNYERRWPSHKYYGRTMTFWLFHDNQFRYFFFGRVMKKYNKLYYIIYNHRTI